jgi:RNA polymerase sigma factor (sigma-70 family)
MGVAPAVERLQDPVSIRQFDDLIQYFPSPSVFTDVMSKSAPDKLEAGDGDLRTVEAFRHETPRLRAWLRRNAAAWQSVDDLLQDLFLELVVANRAVRRVEDMGAWLFRVARNRITDALRQRQPLNRAVSILSLRDPIGSGMDQPIAASEAAGPEAVHRHSIFVHHLVSALQELSAEQRSVFVAHEIDGLSIAEIAQRDGIGINTALARKRYAVLHLRKKLAPFQERYFTD